MIRQQKTQNGRGLSQLGGNFLLLYITTPAITPGTLSSYGATAKHGNPTNIREVQDAKLLGTKSGWRGIP